MFQVKRNSLCPATYEATLDRCGAAVHYRELLSGACCSGGLDTVHRVQEGPLQRYVPITPHGVLMSSSPATSHPRCLQNLHWRGNAPDEQR